MSACARSWSQWRTGGQNPFPALRATPPHRERAAVGGWGVRFYLGGVRTTHSINPPERLAWRSRCAAHVTLLTTGRCALQTGPLRRHAGPHLIGSGARWIPSRTTCVPVERLCSSDLYAVHHETSAQTGTPAHQASKSGPSEDPAARNSSLTHFIFRAPGLFLPISGCSTYPCSTTRRKYPAISSSVSASAAS